MNKRGQMVIIAIIIVVIAVFVGITYPKIAKSLGTGKVALKTAAARDIAFIIDSIYSFPYDVQLEYDYDLSDFIVKISYNTVEIYEAQYSTPEKDLTSAAYSFVPVKDSPEFILNKPKKIVFKKTGDKLEIT